MELLGKTLGNYQINLLLEKGDMGAVYQAHDPSHERDVAIKVMHNYFARQPKFFEHFQHLARNAVATDYPGIVKVYEFGQHLDQLYIVMEYIRGANLRQLLDDLIEERKWLPLSEAVLLVEQLCQTLEYVHQHEMIRRDIKPARLKLKPEPAGKLSFRIVLTDIGLAGLGDGEAGSRETAFTGTPAYMSPERVLGIKTDPRSDVYSLGILLYELAVGLQPFPIKTVKEAVYFHTKVQPPLPRSLSAALPEALEQVILKALAKVPNQRYQRPAELGNALASMIDNSKEIVELAKDKEVSLLTKYIESLSPSLRNKPSRQAIEAGPGKTELRPVAIPDSPGISSKVQSSIEVLSKGKKTQVFTPQTDTVTIGRDQDNQLVILDPEVSRRHAKVTWDGTNYYVTDLNSRNETYLGNIRLQPGVPQIWRASQILRMGDTALRLKSQAQPGIAIEGFGDGQVGALVTPQQLTVEAGESVTVSLFLLNRSPNPDYFSLSLTGIPNSWVSNLPSRVELQPGEQKEITFNLHLPRIPENRAGRRSVTVRVNSQHAPTQFRDAMLALTIAVYSQFTAELQPQHLRAGEAGQLTLANQGNVQETFNVQFVDAASELSFQPPQLQLRVPEGQSATMEFQARLRQTRWIGGEKSHEFSARVKASMGEPQILHANLLSQPLLPLWMLATVLLLCLFFTGSAGALLYFRPQSTPTPMLTSSPLTPIPLDTAITSKLLNGNSVTFTFDAANSEPDDVSFECKLDNDIFTACTSPISYSNLTDASHTFEVRAKDAVGNVDQSPDSFTWTIEITALDTTIMSTPPNISGSNSATFIFNGSDNGISVATFECQLDNGGYTACTSPKVYSNLPDGQHVFEVKAKNVAGNVDQFPATFSWTTDTTPPETTITNKAAIPSNTNAPTFNFNGKEAFSFECKLDGSGFTACTSPMSYSTLSNGSHTFEVRAKDAAGNVDPSPDKFEWTVNATPPDTTITNKATIPSNSSTVTFNFSGTDDATPPGNLTFECKLDTGNFEVCTSPKTYNNLSSSSHTFEVRAKDTAGNVDPSPDKFEWTVNATPPDTTITNKATIPSNSSTVTFNFSGTDDATSPGNLTFECKLDTGNFEICTSPKTYNNLSSSSHTFEVRAKDTAGNVDPSPSSYTWTINTTPPDTTITNKATIPSNSSTVTFNFSGTDDVTFPENLLFECKLDTGIFEACENPNTYDGLSNGSHTFEVRAKDAAGNVDPSPDKFEWAVNATSPENEPLENEAP